MTEQFQQWFIGLVCVSGIAGYLLTFACYGLFGWFVGRSACGNDQEEVAVSETGWLTGLLERLFWSTAVGAWAGFHAGVLPGMMAWVAIKQRTLWRSFAEDKLTPKAFVALCTTLVSLLVALIGGLVCRGAIKLW